jgi:uncharacterized membrane-anchored protein YhcB (DUF1043 family)
MIALLKYVKYVGVAIVIIIFVGLGFRLGDWWRSREVADLKTELSKSAETLELATGLYVRKIEEIDKLTSILDTSRTEVKKLKEHLEDSKAQLLVTEQISIRWKKAYEAALAAAQSEEPPVDGGVVARKRVDFEGTLGPIKAKGFTLTDPPEAFLKLDQSLPILLTMSVAQNKDGTWSTFVTSSEDNIDVKVDLAGVNPLIISPSWYQRIWLGVGATVIGDPAGTLTLGYYGDRFSFGAECYFAGSENRGCGGSLGVRLFK